MSRSKSTALAPVCGVAAMTVLNPSLTLRATCKA